MNQPEDRSLWRIEQRRLLIAQRMAVDKETLRRWREAIDGHIERGFPGLFVTPAAGQRAPVLAISWPHRHEYDARHVAARMRAAGAVIALPVVIAPR